MWDVGAETSQSAIEAAAAETAKREEREKERLAKEEEELKAKQLAEEQGKQNQLAVEGDDDRHPAAKHQGGRKGHHAKGGKHGHAEDEHTHDTHAAAHNIKHPKGKAEHGTADEQHLTGQEQPTTARSNETPATAAKDAEGDHTKSSVAPKGKAGEHKGDATPGTQEKSERPRHEEHHEGPTAVAAAYMSPRETPELTAENVRKLGKAMEGKLFLSDEEVSKALAAEAKDKAPQKGKAAAGAAVAFAGGGDANASGDEDKAKAAYIAPEALALTGTLPDQSRAEAVTPVQTGIGIERHDKPDSNMHLADMLIPPEKRARDLRNAITGGAIPRDPDSENTNELSNKQKMELLDKARSASAAGDDGDKHAAQALIAAIESNASDATIIQDATNLQRAQQATDKEIKLANGKVIKIEDDGTGTPEVSVDDSSKSSAVAAAAETVTLAAAAELASSEAKAAAARQLLRHHRHHHDGHDEGRQDNGESRPVVAAAEKAALALAAMELSAGHSVTTDVFKIPASLTPSTPDRGSRSLSIA